MSLSTTLYRFRIDLSDVDRGVYEALDFRLAKHPSESIVYLFTRALAYALNVQEGLEFSPQGLADPDSPALMIKSHNGGLSLCIEIGNPSARRLHKASKTADKLKVYTYKDPQVLLLEARSEKIHRAGEIEIFSFHHKFLEKITHNLPKEIKMTMIHNEKSLSLSFGSKEGDKQGDRHEETEIGHHKI